VPLSVKSKILVSFIAACLSLAALPARAQPIDPMIEGAKLCTRYLPRYERAYAIPTHLLSAIASTESGRYNESLKMKLPWPWTINAEGKGYFFDSKAEAIAAVRKLQARGIQSIDVGCMQVNLMHHPQAFRSLNEAFEPQNNVAYASSFLRELYQENGSWKTAAAYYHSHTPARGTEYVSQVYESWYKIIERLRAAKMQSPEYQVAMNQEPPPPPPKPKLLPEQVGKKVADRVAPRMNLVELSKKEPANGGLIVVQPDTSQPKPITLAQAKPETPSVQVTVGDSRIIRVSEPVPITSRKTGPNFIFND